MPSPAVETAGFKMIDVVRAKILSEKGVLKFLKPMHQFKSKIRTPQYKSHFKTQNDDF